MHATDRFTNFASELLPFVFLAKHDADEIVKKVFTSTWDEHVAGSRSVALYLNEILTLCSQHLDSRQWAIKHTAAKAVADTVLSITSAVGSENLDRTSADKIWPALDKALSGKSWDGKEVVLDAIELVDGRGQES